MSLEDMERTRLDAIRRAKGGRVGSGKANAFPLRPPSVWTRREGGDTSLEDPLLINPFERNPARHIEWAFDWDRGVSELWNARKLLITAKPVQRRGVDDPYGVATIGLLGLNRVELAVARISWAVHLQKAASDVVWSATKQATARSRVQAAEFQQKFEADKRWLEQFGEVSRPWSAMSKAFLRLFDAELVAYLSK